MNFPRYSLTITIVGRKRIKFTIWDNQTGDSFKKYIVGVANPETIRILKYEWETLLNTLNA